MYCSVGKMATEVKFVKELPKKFKCSICTHLLDTPVLTEMLWTAFL